MVAWLEIKASLMLIFVCSLKVGFWNLSFIRGWTSPEPGCRSCLFAGFIPMQLLVWQFARAWLTKYLITLLAIRRADISRLLTSSPAGQDHKEKLVESLQESLTNIILSDLTAVWCQARAKSTLFNPSTFYISNLSYGKVASPLRKMMWCGLVSESILVH